MKILILSVTAGQGHHQAGLAVSTYFEDRGHTAVHLDCYEYLSPPVKEFISHGYLMSTKYSPTLYGRFYRLAEKMDELETANFISKITNTIFRKKMLTFIETTAPDAILCTHVFAAILLSHLKEKGLDIPTYGIVTDFTIHPYWESTALDYYVAANEFLIPAAMNKKIPKESVLPFGIPIFEKFAHRISAEMARERLEIGNKDTILIMGGSMGFGNMLKTLTKLDKIEEDFQIISVCGNNLKLKENIDKLETKHTIHNFGYMSNVDLLMDAADCIITKPGGLTTSEALAKELPIIISKPIPGQEERNVDFLLNFGCGMKISKPIPAVEIISQLFLDKRKKETMMENIRLIRKPNAVCDLYNHILNKTFSEKDLKN